MNYDQAMVAIYRYYLDTGDWKTPSITDCSRFVMQEAAETDSALMKAGYQAADHSRNNSTSCSEAMEQVEKEIGQAFVMLCTLGNLLGINLTDAGLGFLNAMHMKHSMSVDSDAFRIASECMYDLGKTKRVGYVMGLLATLDHELEESR